MHEEQIRLVRENWAQVEPIADEVATSFYERLFTIDPPTRQLFSDDMTQQRRKLMVALRTAVRSLDRPEELRPALEGMGQRHAQYGVEPKHFDSVGQALLHTLAEKLGDDFTEAHSSAWQQAYGLISDIMTDALQTARGARA